jgi:hypothetical protein
VRPIGAFGQTLPQNCPSAATSAAVKSKGVAPQSNIKEFDHLDPDGLPHTGAPIWPRQAVYSTKDAVSGRFKTHPLKGEEVAVVDQVRVVYTCVFGLVYAYVCVCLWTR